jgi:release factor glutamine methyltransferase
VFQVSPAVLIPRPETDVLIELALEKLQGMSAPRVLDLGTGSGIVAISLALECPSASVVAIDLSADALVVARNNAGRLGAHVDCRQGDWFLPVAGDRFDIIVSNPPYVADGDPHLALNGLPFEPQMALTDGADGLACIRHIVATAVEHLKPGGWLFLSMAMIRAMPAGTYWLPPGSKRQLPFPTWQASTEFQALIFNQE